MSETAIDPVCGMEVEIATAQWTQEYNGETYYFCAPGCRFTFTEDPEKYVQGGPVGMHGEHEHDHSEHDHHDHEDEHDHEHEHHH